MKSSTINNLVFVKDSNGELRVHVFYKNGKHKEISKEDGLKLIKVIAAENNITTKKAFSEVFRNLVNKDLIHVVSEREFNKKFGKEVLRGTENNRDTVILPVNTVSNETKKPVELKEESSFFKKVMPKKNDKKKKSLKVRIAAAVLAATVGLTGTAFGLSKVSKSGIMHKSNLKASTTELNNEDKELVQGNNDYYDSYTFEQLQEVTQNAAQKAEMKRIHDALYGYNIDFAENYLEEGKDIRAALSFQEVVALSQAYNDFTPDEIKAIFNGKTITAAELDSSYKTATLQLMGAHVIESREHPVDMSGIIVSEEGKAFYEKYHNLFLNAKEATGDEKVAAVEAFYNEVRNDFPIDPDTREVGISHSNSHQAIESYKLAITPMVAAGEIMWQNLDIDKTLQGGINSYFFGNVDVNELSRDELVEIILNGNVGVAKGEIDYFNDLGLCNIAEGKFEIVQQITMGAISNSDKTNPRYDQYENAMVKELTDKNAYVIDDAHRELSELDRFQDEVNWHFELNEEGYYTGSVYYTTETHTRTRTWKKTKTTKRTEVTRTEKEITDEAKKEVDKKIEEENKQAKEEGEKKAEETRQEIQDKEDQKAEEIKEEVKKDEEDLQEKIEDANDKIKENQEITKENEGKPAEEQKPTDPVNEEDFGDHNVDFDDQHSDSQGNLDDSVENITTDGTGAKTPSDLPDPNETGKKFDEEGEKQAKSNSSAAPKAEVKSAPAPKAEPAKKNYEEKVDAYVEEMSQKSSSDDEAAKELTK